MKLQSKLTIAFSTLALSSVLIIGTFTYLLGQKTLLEEAHDDLSSFATIEVTRVESIIENNFDRLSLIASRTQLRKSLANYNRYPNHASQTRMNKILQDALGAVKELEEVSVLDIKGEVIASTNVNAMGTIMDAKYLQHENLHKKDQMLLFMHELHGAQLHYFEPLYLDNIRIGSLVLQVSPKRLFEALTSYGILGQTGESYIIERSRDGSVLVLTPTRFDHSSAFNLRISAQNTSSPDIRAFQDANGVVKSLKDYRDQNVLAISYPVFRDDWRLIVKMDEAEVLKFIHLWRNQLGQIIGVVLIFALFLSFYISRQLGNSLAQLTQRVTEFGSGVSRQFTPVAHRDWEISQLDKAFSEMAITRRAAEEELKQREKYIGLTLDSIGDGVIATNAEGCVTRMNPVAEKLTGWSATSAIGKPLLQVFNIIHAETRVPVRNPVEKVIEYGKVVGLANHTVLISKQGDEYHIADSAAPISECGFILGVILVFRDITEEYNLRLQNQENEHFFKNVLNDMQTFVGVTEPDGTLIFINNTPMIAAGVQEQDVLGKRLWETTWFQHNKNLREQVKQDVIKTAGGESVLHDIQIKLGDHLLWIQFSMHPFYDSEGRVKYLVPEGQNIEARVNTESALIESERRLRLHQEQTTVGVIEWNTELKVIAWNPAAEKIFGYSGSEILGRDGMNLIVPEAARAAVKARWQNLFRQMVGTHSVDENQTKKGKAILCEWFNTPLTDAHGDLIGVASFVTDVTQQTRQEEQLRRKQKLDSLGQLTGGIAHDFNNMLNVVLGYTELMKTQITDPEKLMAYLKEIEKAGARGASLTRKLLGFSRLQPASPVKCDLNQSIMEAQGMLEKTLTPRIVIASDLEPELWPIMVDVGEFQDALINMSINAMHAMPEGGTLTFSTKNASLSTPEANELELEQGDYVKFSIIDTGAGMNSSVQSQIFEPFYTTKGEKGSGLGLSQVYGFIKRAKGGIRVFSGAKIGSRFDLFFPRLVYDIQSASIQNEQIEKNLSGDEKILIVEDEPALQMLMSEILHRQGYQVEVADNGQSALTFLARQQVDLIVSDIIMPIMDGHELKAQVAALYPQIKFQLVSGFDDKTSNEDAECELLLKPFLAEDLLNKIRDLLDKEVQ